MFEGSLKSLINLMKNPSKERGIKKLMFYVELADPLLVGVGDVAAIA